MGVTPRHDTGVTPESAIDLARAVSKCQKVETLFAKAMLVQIVDPDLSDKALRILLLIRACSFDGPIALSYREIGKAAKCSERQAIRICNQLRISGRLSVRYRRTIRNVFSVPSTLQPLHGSRLRTSRSQCLRCNRSGRPTGPLGVCAICRKQERTEQEVAALLLERGPAPGEIVYLGLKAGGSKASAKEIRRAYAKLTEAA